MNSSRRFFVNQLGAGLSAPFFVRNLLSAPPSDALRLASFGAGGMAFHTLDGIARHKSVRLAAVAEVDSSRLGNLKQKYSSGEFTVYKDWRRLLEKEHKNLDIACVGTPDHMHAPIAMSAMQAGLHVYVQKPLTHNIYEARRLTRFARGKKLVSQMGIQNHSSSQYRSAVSLVQGGAIGKIKEVHAWSHKKWGDPEPVPDRSDPVPETLDWDLWLGVASRRAYLRDYYHPRDWRKRLDFGTGTFGDMGCHIYDPIFEALALTAPVSVRSEGPQPNRHNWANNAIVRYVFPGTRFTADATVNVTWYDGDERPPREIQALVTGQPLPDQGSIFVGTGGAMLLPHLGFPVLFPAQGFKDFAMPKIEPDNHYFQFVDAVLGRAKATAPFEYSGPLTEAVLLGGLASRFPKATLRWNAGSMKFQDNAEADRLLRRRYRSGWSVKALS